LLPASGELNPFLFKHGRPTGNGRSGFMGGSRGSSPRLSQRFCSCRRNAIVRSPAMLMENGCMRRRSKYCETASTDTSMTSPASQSSPKIAWVLACAWFQISWAAIRTSARIRLPKQSKCRSHHRGSFAAKVFIQSQEHLTQATSPDSPQGSSCGLGLLLHL
jgi:hypothetical protein